MFRLHMGTEALVRKLRRCLLRLEGEVGRVFARRSGVLGGFAFGHVLNEFNNGIPKEEAVHISCGGKLCGAKGGNYRSIISVLADQGSGRLGNVWIYLSCIFIYGHPDGLRVARVDIKVWVGWRPGSELFPAKGRRSRAPRPARYSPVKYAQSRWRRDRHLSAIQKSPVRALLRKP